MPKMRGFLRSDPKKDEADWTIAQIRTAARLEDMFAGTEPPNNKEGSAGPAREGEEAGAPAPIVIATGPWPHGPRPPIIVVGSTEVPPAPVEEAAARPADIPGDAGPAQDAHSFLAPTEEVVTAQAVAHAQAAGERVPVMAGPADDLADEGWDLPEAPRAEAPRPVAQLALPVAAPLQPAPREARPAKPSSGRRREGPGRASGDVARSKTRSAPAPAARCPYCADLLEPPPTTSRRCGRCRQRIVVKRVNNATVYLTEAAVLVFDAERRRVANSARWTRERDSWLQLAAGAGASPARREQLAEARVSEAVVAAARTLYVSTVDRAYRAARHAHDWEEASRARRAKAAVLYRLAGSGRPPTDEVIAIFREGVAAELRGVAEISRDAELVSAGCCAICRADDRIIVRISRELRQPRLPHAGCPRGLCRCRWELAARDRMTVHRYLRRRPAARSRVPVDEPVSSA